MKRLLLLLVLCIPTAVQAVEITEVAWMGSVDSANYEWVELYNSGSAVVVDGWTLSDGTNLNIVLSGTIPATSHAVLERTSDASAPGAAFLIYTGALVNSGATLTLRDNVGQVVDQVVGGDDWESIGGDNASKETAQRTTSGWATAIATPGSGYTGAVVEPSSVDEDSDDESDNTKSNSQKTSKKSSDPIVLTLPDVTLQLAIDAPSYAHVHQSVDFSVIPSGIGDTLLNSLEYQWNFGDGTSVAGKDVTHAFSYPGRYVVVVDGGYKRQQQVARFEIEVYPVEISLTTNDDGSVTIHNHATDEIDLSEYRLVGRETVTLPEYTIVLPGEQITLSRQRIGGSASGMMVVLYDQADSVVAMQLPGAVAEPNRLAAAVPQSVVANTVVSAAPAPRISALSHSRVIDQSPTENQRFAFATDEQHSAPDDLPTGNVALAADGLTATSQLATVGRSSQSLPTEWPLYALIGLLLLGIASVYLIPTYPRGED